MDKSDAAIDEGEEREIGGNKFGCNEPRRDGEEEEAASEGDE